MSVTSLAHVIRKIEEHPTLRDQRRADIVSALNKLCAVLGTEPSSVAADARALRHRMGRLSAAAAGVTEPRWANIKSAVRASLKLAGIPVMAGRSRAPLLPEWELLRERLKPDRRHQSGLSRLLSFCSERNITPETINAATFEAFGRALEEESIGPDPGRLYRETCLLWNTARAVEGWPPIEVPVPDRRDNFSFALETFPSSFAQDLERYVSARADPDIFADEYCKPAKAITLKNRRQQLLQLATAAVKSGLVPQQDITSLAVLVRVDCAKAALGVLHKRAGKKTGYIHHVATQLKSVARHHVKADAATLEKLGKFTKDLCPGEVGLTEKNKECLRQFADPKKLRALLTLPQRLIERAEGQRKLRRRDALSVCVAVAVAIELRIPLRVRDLTLLRPDIHLRRYGEKTFLSIKAAKNSRAIEADLPPSLIRMIQLLRTKYRPIMTEADSPFLFPNFEDTHRCPGGFGVQIKKTIYEEVGVRMTTHQFRHLAAKLYLDAHPGDYETVRQLLGHQSIQTTLKFYYELDKIFAAKRYSEVVDKLLDKDEGNVGDDHAT